MSPDCDIKLKRERNNQIDALHISSMIYLSFSISLDNHWIMARCFLAN